MKIITVLYILCLLIFQQFSFSKECQESTCTISLKKEYEDQIKRLKYEIRQNSIKIENLEHLNQLMYIISFRKTEKDNILDQYLTFRTFEEEHLSLPRQNTVPSNRINFESSPLTRFIKVIVQVPFIIREESEIRRKNSISNFSSRETQKIEKEFFLQKKTSFSSKESQTMKEEINLFQFQFNNNFTPKRAYTYNSYHSIEGKRGKSFSSSNFSDSTSLEGMISHTYPFINPFKKKKNEEEKDDLILIDDIPTPVSSRNSNNSEKNEETNLL